MDSRHVTRGWDRSLFPELCCESPIPLTNGSGVLSASRLGEFVMLGVLYFAKDVPRRMRAKAEHRWDVFDNVEISSSNPSDHCGPWRHSGAALCSSRAKALGMRVLALRS